jgi:hypothetical protein
MESYFDRTNDPHTMRAMLQCCDINSSIFGFASLVAGGQPADVQEA